MPSQPSFTAPPSAPIAAASPIPAPAHATSPETEKSEAEIEKLTGVGGWLLFLVVILIIIQPLVLLGSFVSAYRSLGSLAISYEAFGDLLEIAGVLSALMAAWSIYVGLRLSMAAPNGATVARWYFGLGPVAFIGQALLMLYVPDLPEGTIDEMMKAMAAEFIRTLVPSVVWLLYLTKSKRVRYTFPDRKK